jgi:hypothetical protein
MAYSIGSLILLGFVIVLLLCRDRQLTEAFAFPSPRPEDPELARLNSILVAINAEPTRLKFFAERYIIIDLDGVSVQIIHGTIGGASAGEEAWTNSKGAFCLIDRATQDSLCRNSRLFDLSYEGERYAIYRANTHRILAHQKAAAVRIG